MPLYILYSFVPLSIISGGFLSSQYSGSGRFGCPSNLLKIGIIVSIGIIISNLIIAYIPVTKNLYPMVAAIDKRAQEEDFHIYSTWEKLYTIPFYTGKKLRYTKNLSLFLDDPSEKFLIIKSSDFELDPPRELRVAELLMKHFYYRLYYIDRSNSQRE